MPKRIDALIRERVANAVIPAPVSGQRWQRFRCPFCGKERAAVNHAAGWFQCFHADCGITISASGEYSPIARFGPQIRQAVRNIVDDPKWGEWFTWKDEDDLKQECRVFVLEYEKDGKVDTWEADVNGDPDLVDRNMLQELNWDLSTWCRRYASKRRHDKSLEHLPDETNARQVWQAIETPDDRAIWLSWPTLEYRIMHRMTNEEIAKHLGVSESTVDRRISAEMESARAFYLEKGALSDCYKVV